MESLSPGVHHALACESLSFCAKTVNRESRVGTCATEAFGRSSVRGGFSQSDSLTHEKAGDWALRRRFVLPIIPYPEKIGKRLAGQGSIED